MTEYLTEQEQIQQLKNWIKTYGPAIMAGVIVAGLLAFGWNYWQSYRNKILLHASGVYDEMLTTRAQNNNPAAVIQAKKLLSHYPKTPYAEMAALLLARDAILKKNYPEAIKQLDWVRDHSSESSIRQIARLRKARIFLAENQPDMTLSLIKKIDDKTFIGLIEEVEGDAYVMKNDKISAKNAYQKASQDLPNAEVIQPVLQMKLDNLASSYL